jgi:hypothetical protein
MADDPPKPSREDRLAAQLRANLRRRKAQARALQPVTAEPIPMCRHEIEARDESSQTGKC